MRIFVSEYVCGGAWPDERLPESLAIEGRSMLLALLEDASRNPQWEICTTWDRQLGDFPQLDVTPMIVGGAVEEQSAFDGLARECDATYIIAPELDDLLGQRCQRVKDVGGVNLNCSGSAISLCSDKLKLARRLEELEFPTLPSQLLDSSTVSPRRFPIVVKPRFGAGSQDMRLVETSRRFEELRSRFGDEPECRQVIMQPFVNGMPVSVAAFFDDQGQLTDLGPVVEQRLSEDGRFTFLGGRIPAKVTDSDAINDLVREVAGSVPGLRGYVGFDVLLPNRRPERPMLVEINPRLTTSYLGYRALTGDNLAEHVLMPHAAHGNIAWGRDIVQFWADGSVRRRMGQETEEERDHGAPVLF